MEIRTLNADDSPTIPCLVKIHMEAAPTDFMVRLGVPFLKEVLYVQALRSAHSKVFAAYDGTQLIGFVLVTYDTKLFLTELTRSPHFWIILALKTNLLTSFRLLIDAIYAFLFSFTKNKLLIPSEILMLATRKDYQRRSVARTLMNALWEDLKKKRLSACKLRVESTNCAALSFYRKTNWQERGQIYLFRKRWLLFVQESRLLNRF